MGQNCLANRSACSRLIFGGGWGVGVSLGIATGQAQPAKNNNDNISKPKLLFTLDIIPLFASDIKG
jgi:hypothetical protein